MFLNKVCQNLKAAGQPVGLRNILRPSGLTETWPETIW